jgi:hypothetical protein
MMTMTTMRMQISPNATQAMIMMVSVDTRAQALSDDTVKQQQQQHEQTNVQGPLWTTTVDSSTMPSSPPFVDKSSSFVDNSGSVVVPFDDDDECVGDGVGNSVGYVDGFGVGRNVTTMQK